MTKEITFTTGERYQAIKILNEFKGKISELAAIIDDVKKFAITDAEWAEDHLSKTPSDEAVRAMTAEDRAKTTQTWTWDNKVEKTIALSEETVKYLVGAIEAKSDAGELTLADSQLVTVASKLK